MYERLRYVRPELFSNYELELKKITEVHLMALFVIVEHAPLTPACDRKPKRKLKRKLKRMVWIMCRSRPRATQARRNA